MKNRVVIKELASQRWLDLQNPLLVIETERVEEVSASFQRVEALVHEQNLYAAGFVSYEAAPAFDPALRVRPLESFPLLWFGLYPEPVVLERLSGPGDGESYGLGPWEPSVTKERYDNAIQQVKEHIERGETYQVNYTFRLRAAFEGGAWALFHDLMQAQPTPYAAYIDTGRYALCSVSPELFFRLDRGEILARPMKGTAARGRFPAEDEAQAEWLRQSKKNQAENVMIVDMLRNDIGRVAKVGTVRVPELFQIERYPTVWQMVSTVTGTTDASLSEIMAALFPCASITGAPKRSTMGLISGLETTPRRVYTGCIGLISPSGQARFSVAIRTVLVDREASQAEYGVGGGIVWDSDSAEEYEECRMKARVLTRRAPDFSLLETILWEPGEGFFLLPYHLQRLAESARYFDIPLSMADVREQLSTLGDLLSKSAVVRLLVARDGAISVEVRPWAVVPASAPVRVAFALAPVDTADLFLYHKTTHREVYTRAKSGCVACDDVLLWNERGEITETTIGNIVVELDGELWTPPVTSGLLPGTFRASLLDQGQVRERVITKAMLEPDQRIFRINSVRKWQEIRLVP